MKRAVFVLAAAGAFSLVPMGLLVTVLLPLVGGLLNPLYGSILAAPPRLRAMLVVAYALPWVAASMSFLAPARDRVSVRHVLLAFAALLVASVPLVDAVAEVLVLAGAMAPTSHVYIINCFVGFPLASLLGLAAALLPFRIIHSQVATFTLAHALSLACCSFFIYCTLSPDKFAATAANAVAAVLSVIPAFAAASRAHELFLSFSSSFVLPFDTALFYSLSPPRATLALATSILIPLIASSITLKPSTSSHRRKRKNSSSLSIWFPIIAAATACSAAFLYSFNPHYSDFIDLPIQITSEFTLVERRGSVSVLRKTFSGNRDTGNEITLLRAGHSLIGATFEKTQESAYAIFYYHEMHLYIPDAPRRRDALMVGYGIGSGARALLDADVRVTAYEISPDVALLAQKHFYAKSKIQPGLLELKVSDAARAALDTWQPQSYNIIIHDVFAGGGTPSALATFEHFAHVRRALRMGGTVSVNVVGRWRSPAVSCVVMTVRSIFPKIRVFAEVQNDKASLTNFIIFASVDTPLLFSRPMPEKSGKECNDNIRKLVLVQFFDNEIPLNEKEIPYAAKSVYTSSPAANFSWPTSSASEADKFAIPKAPMSPESQQPFIITEQNRAHFERLTQGDAVEHWRIMRDLVPFAVWAQY